VYGCLRTRMNCDDRLRIAAHRTRAPSAAWLVDEPGEQTELPKSLVQGSIGPLGDRLSRRRAAARSGICAPVAHWTRGSRSTSANRRIRWG